MKGANMSNGGLKKDGGDRKIEKESKDGQVSSTGQVVAKKEMPPGDTAEPKKSAVESGVRAG